MRMLAEQYPLAALCPLPHAAWRGNGAQAPGPAQGRKVVDRCMGVKERPEGCQAGSVPGSCLDLASPCQVFRNGAAEMGGAVWEWRVSVRSVGLRQGQQTVSGSTVRDGDCAAIWSG